MNPYRSNILKISIKVVDVQKIRPHSFTLWNFIL